MPEDVRRDFFHETLSPKQFLDTFSRREVMTSFALALFSVALSNIYEYYDTEPWGSTYRWIMNGCLLLAPIFNHVIYRLEHKRSNNYIGRVLHTLLFIVLTFLIYGLTEYLVDGYVPFIGGLPFFIVTLLLAVTMFEIGIAGLKQILKRLRWQIL